MDDIKHLKKKSFCLRDINLTHFPPPWTYLNQGEAHGTKKTERSTCSFCEEEQLLNSIRENFMQDATGGFSHNTREGSKIQRHDGTAHPTSLPQNSENCAMMLHLKREPPNDTDIDALWHENWANDRSCKLSCSMASRTNQSQDQRGFSGFSNKMSFLPRGLSTTDLSTVPVFPKALRLSSGNSSPETLGTEPKITCYNSESDHIELSDYINSKELSESSSHISHAHNHTSDTSMDERFAGTAPQSSVPYNENECIVSENIEFLVKNMGDTIKNDTGERSRTWEWKSSPADFKSTETWPKLATTVGDTASSAGSKEQASCSDNDMQPHSHLQSQLKDRRRCDTPMMKISPETPVSTGLQLAASSELPQSIISDLQREYQDNYEYFASLKAYEAMNANRSHLDNGKDEAEGKVYENIFLGVDVVHSQSETGQEDDFYVAQDSRGSLLL